MKYETAREIEQAVARWFNARVNLPVARASWGVGLHECDVLILTKVGYAIEVEIKISRADILKDLAKIHAHSSSKIKKLFFAIPKKIEKHMGLIPERAGVIVVGELGDCELKRRATTNVSARKWTGEERYELARLGALRYWNRRSEKDSINEKEWLKENPE